MITATIYFSNPEAACDFVKKARDSNENFFGVVAPEKIVEAIQALDLSPIEEQKAESLALIHGLRWMIKMEVEVHSYGDKITSDPEAAGWITDTRNKVSVTREPLADYIYKRQPEDV